MKPEFVKCGYCKTEISSGTCQFAALTTTVDGKKYTFCCVKCAERYKQKKGKKKL